MGYVEISKHNHKMSFRHTGIVYHCSSMSTKLLKKYFSKFEKQTHTHKIDVCDCFSKFKKTIFLHVLFFKGAVEEVIVENTFWSGVQYSYLAPADPSLADFSAVLSIYLALIFI